MVSLNRSDVWPIGSQGPDAMCTCVPDPVGMPDVTATRKAGLDDLTYLGRAEIGVEYINKTVVVEHYANWFFHVFMSTDTEDPAYGKAPIRLASAYAGTAVYQDWIFADPEVTHPGIFTVDVPTHSAPFPMFGEFCLNPTRQVSPHPCAHIKTFDDDAGPATWPPSADDPIALASPTFV